MAKKLGVTLIVIALVICIAYAVFCVVKIRECPVETTRPSAFVKNDYKAELIYNALMYNSGAYEYSIKAYVNIDMITKGASLADVAARKQQSKDAIKAIKEQWEQNGYDVEASEDYCVSATIAYYDSYETLQLANGETGYDLPSKSGKVYRGWLFNDYVSERTTVFKEESGTVLSAAEEELNKIDGIGVGDVSLVFNYGTMYKTATIGSDADQIYKRTDKETGISTVIHEFRMTNDNRGRVITLVQHTPNSYTWYLVPVTLSLFIAGVVLSIAGAKRSK